MSDKQQIQHADFTHFSHIICTQYLLLSASNTIPNFKLQTMNAQGTTAIDLPLEGGMNLDTILALASCQWLSVSGVNCSSVSCR